MQFILALLQQPSTWRGIAMIVTAIRIAFGDADPEELKQSLIQGMSLVGALGLLPDGKKQ